jgi:hypothetical protein
MRHRRAGGVCRLMGFDCGSKVVVVGDGDQAARQLGNGAESIDQKLARC